MIDESDSYILVFEHKYMNVRIFHFVCARLRRREKGPIRFIGTGLTLNSTTAQSKYENRFKFMASALLDASAV